MRLYSVLTRIVCYDNPGFFCLKEQIKHRENPIETVLQLKRKGEHTLPYFIVVVLLIWFEESPAKVGLFCD